MTRSYRIVPHNNPGGVVSGRQVSMVPLALGALAVVITVVGWFLAGLMEPTGGGLLFIGALSAVVASTVWGNSNSLYLALTIIVVTTQLPAWQAGPAQSASRVALVALLVVVIHELVRLSHTARSPMSFAAGVARAYLGRTLAVVVASVVLTRAGFTVASRWVQDDSSHALWPLAPALAVASLGLLLAAPLVAQRVLPTASHRVRLGLGVAVVSSVTLACAVGASVGFRFANSNGRPRFTNSSGGVSADVVQNVNPSPINRTPVLDSPIDKLWMAALALALVGLVVLSRQGRRDQIGLHSTVIEPSPDPIAVLAPSRSEVCYEEQEIPADQAVSILEDLLLEISKESDPGRAIRFGYATIERRLGEHGVVRSSYQTEQELLARALKVLGASGQPLQTLTTLFEQARFGSEPITERHRTEASDAIAALLAVLVASQ